MPGIPDIFLAVMNVLKNQFNKILVRVLLIAQWNVIPS